MIVKPLAEKPVIGRSTRDKAISSLLNVDLPSVPQTEGSKDLVGDCFLSMYKQSPTVLENVSPDRSVNQALMQWANEKGIDREGIAGNIPASLFSAGVLWANLTNDKNVKEALEKQEEAKKAAEEAQKRAEAATKAIQDAIDSGNENPDSQAMKITEQLLSSAREAQKQAQAIAAEAKSKIDDMISDTVKSVAMKEAVSKASEEGKKVSAMMKSWGVEDGVNSSMDISLIMRYASDKNIAKLSEMLGRLRGRAATILAGSKRSNTGVVAEVGRTKEIDKLLTSEFANLTPMAPVPVRAKAIQTLFGNGLVGWTPIEQKKKSGSFVAAVDESGSMSEYGCMLEKAMTLGIAKATQDELESGRRYSMFGFSNKVLRTIHETDDWRTHMQWASSFDCGGTNFDAAITEMLDIIEDYRSQDITDCDALLITDGLCSVDDSVLSRLDHAKETMGIRMFLIILGGYPNEELESRCITAHFSGTESFEDDIEMIVDKIADMIGSHYNE